MRGFPSLVLGIFILLPAGGDKRQVHIHTHTLGARERIEGAASRILSTTHRKRKRLLQQRIDPEKIEFAHFFQQDPEQRKEARESENVDENHFSVGKSVDHIQNISSRILVKAGERRLVLLRRQRVDIFPKSRNSDSELNEVEESGPSSHNPELKNVEGSSGEKELTGVTLGHQPDREIQDPPTTLLQAETFTPPAQGHDADKGLRKGEEGPLPTSPTLTDAELPTTETSHGDGGPRAEDTDETTTKVSLVNSSPIGLQVIGSDSEVQVPMVKVDSELMLAEVDVNENELSELIILTTPRSGISAIDDNGSSQPTENDDFDFGSGLLDSEQSESIADIQFNFEEAFQEMNLVPLTKGNRSTEVEENNELVIGELNSEIEATTTTSGGIVCDLAARADNSVEGEEMVMEGCEPAEGTTTTEGSGLAFEQEENNVDPLAGLVGLDGELSSKDRRIVLTLMELEELRGRQQDMKHEIQVRLNILEALLEGGNALEIGNNSLSTKQPRKGKTFAEDGLGPNFVETVGKIAGAIPGLVVSKVQGVKATFHLFDNLQRQILSLLETRVEFLHVISRTIQQEVEIFKQTLEFFKRLVNFKLDQTEILLGRMNPITEILQSGSTSVFLLITRFFEAVESVFALKRDFARAFSGERSGRREVHLLERIQELKFNTILPRKMRLLLNVHAHSEELRDMINEIFICVGGLLEAKRDVIQAVGIFVDSQVEFLSGLTGPSLTVPALIEAVTSGTLYKLLNFGPQQFSGLPIKAKEFEEMVEQMLAGLGPGPSVPFLGPVKPLLVDHRILGALAGRARERLVNRFLARRLSAMMAASHTLVKVRQGETLVSSSLPPVSLGTPCDNEVHLGHSRSTATVARTSRFSTTAGLTINSHAPPTADLFAHANLLVNMDIVGSFRTSIGRRLFGQCINKFSGSFPMKARGKATGHAFAKVLVSSVRLEVRRTTPTPFLGNVLNVTLGVERPHLVFTFNVRLDGTLHSLDISNLKLTGCEIKFLGIKMFSVCGLIEKVVKQQIEKVTEESFPLRAGPFLREIERAIKMRVGQEVAIPLVLRDGANLDPANRAISKTQRLIQLNVELFHALVALTKDMENAKAEEENVVDA